MEPSEWAMLVGALLILLSGSVLVLWQLDEDDRLEDLRRRRAQERLERWSTLGEP